MRDLGWGRWGGGVAVASGGRWAGSGLGEVGEADGYWVFRRCQVRRLGSPSSGVEEVVEVVEAAMNASGRWIELRSKEVDWDPGLWSAAAMCNLSHYRLVFGKGIK